MPAFIWDYVWLIWIRFRDIDSSVVRCDDLIPPHTIDWPKSPYWLGLTLFCARGGPDHPQCNRGRPITHLPMMPGSALNNFIVLLVKIFQAKKNFENRTISSWDNPYAKNRSKRLVQNRVKNIQITTYHWLESKLPLDRKWSMISNPWARSYWSW